MATDLTLLTDLVRRAMIAHNELMFEYIDAQKEKKPVPLPDPEFLFVAKYIMNSHFLEKHDKKIKFPSHEYKVKK